MAENKDKVKLEDTFSADEAAVKTTSENKEENPDLETESLNVTAKETADFKERAEKAEEAVVEMKEKKEETEAKLETALSQYIRLQADFENFRRRSRENEAKLSDTVKAGTMKEFLPIVDTFEMAMEQIKKSNPGDSFIQGVEMLVKQFVKTLSDFGVTEIEAQGKPFDPYYHEALMEIQSDDVEEDTVAAVLQKGYMIGEEVLRPSKVQVAHK